MPSSRCLALIKGASSNMKLKNTLTLLRFAGKDVIGLEQRPASDTVHIEEAMQWLCRAQDATPDGGVSEGFHLYHGWLPSYPETSGIKYPMSILQKDGRAALIYQLDCPL